MSVPKRKVDFDPALPFADLLRLLDATDESVSVVVKGEPVVVELRPVDPANPYAHLSNEEKLAKTRSALGGWKGLIDLDELERQIYADREVDRFEPPVTIE